MVSFTADGAIPFSNDIASRSVCRDKPPCSGFEFVKTLPADGTYFSTFFPLSASCCNIDE